jgi:small subunit ribosomal protein S1
VNTVNIFLPEGRLIGTNENNRNIELLKSLCESPPHIPVEARAVLCDTEHNLHLDMNGMKGLIPFSESMLTDGDEIKEIAVISRVSKPVSAIPLRYTTLENGERALLLSRRLLQKKAREEYLDLLESGDIIDATVTRLERFGAFCDVGAGISALLPIDNISVSRIPHPAARLRNGQKIKVIVRDRDYLSRLVL